LFCARPFFLGFPLCWGNRALITTVFFSSPFLGLSAPFFFWAGNFFPGACFPPPHPSKLSVPPFSSDHPGAGRCFFPSPVRLVIPCSPRFVPAIFCVALFIWGLTVLPPFFLLDNVFESFFPLLVGIFEFSQSPWLTSLFCSCSPSDSFFLGFFFFPHYFFYAPVPFGDLAWA